jgi:hypothetical protein
VVIVEKHKVALTPILCFVPSRETALFGLLHRGLSTAEAHPPRTAASRRWLALGARSSACCVARRVLTGAPVLGEVWLVTHDMQSWTTSAVDASTSRMGLVSSVRHPRLAPARPDMSTNHVEFHHLHFSTSTTLAPHWNN